MFQKVLMALLAIAVIAGVVALMVTQLHRETAPSTEYTPAKQWHTILNLKGTESATTEVFNITGNSFRIIWSAMPTSEAVFDNGTGGIFALFVYPEFETVFYDEAVIEFDLMQPQSSIVYGHHEPKRYYLEIVAKDLANWKIQVQSYH